MGAPTARPTLLGAARAASVALVGLFLGFLGAMVQTYVVRVGGQSLPVGVALALVALVLVARACAWWVDSRWGAVLFSSAWLVTTLLMATTTSGGDLVVSAGDRQLAYLVIGAMVLASACGFPLLPGDSEAPERVPGVAGDA